MAKQIIDARVRQKVGTEAEWLANDLELLDGEAAVVRTGDGMPVNLKFGDGNKKFSELPYFIDFNNAQRISSVSPGALPTPTEENVYMVVTGVGAYTYGGTTIGTNADGYQTTFWFNGITWVNNGSVRVKGDTPSGTNLLIDEEIPKGIAVKNFTTPMFSTGSIDYTPYVITNKGYDAAGEVIVAFTGSIVKDMPIDVTKTNIYIDNAYNDTLAKYFFRDSEGAIIGTVRGFNNVNMEIPIPVGAVSFSFTLFRSTNPLKNDFVVRYVASSDVYLNSAFGSKIEATKLSVDNVTPFPTSNENAVNKGYMDEYSVLKSSIGKEDTFSKNQKLDISYKVKGKFINSDGTIGTGANTNEIIENHPSDGIAGKTVTLSGIGEDNLKKIVFRDLDGIVIPPVLGMTPVPKTFYAPSESVTFDMTLKRSAESADNYKFAMINIGEEALPYEPYMQEYINSIDGIPLISSGGGGSEEYDQSLNTNDEVEFNTIKTGVLEMVSWTVDLPTGAGSPPSEVEIGDAWIDTTNNTIKVRRS